MSRKTDGKKNMWFVVFVSFYSVLLKPTCKVLIIYLGESRRIIILIRNNDSDRNFYRGTGFIGDANRQFDRIGGLKILMNSRYLCD
jgi:hypothetical protein